MKTKLTSVTYLGFTAMDRRFSNAMLPWLLKEIKATGIREKLSIAVEEGCLKAYNSNFEPAIVHRLVDIVRASQVPGHPEELFYILLNEKEALLNCFLFRASSDVEVSDLFTQMREPSPGASPRGSTQSLTAAVTRNIGFQQSNSSEHVPWTAPAVTSNCNTNLSTDSPAHGPLIRSLSNASALTSLCADLSPSDSHFFEVLYIGKVRISQRKVPESLIDDALVKFAQHEAEKALRGRRHSLLSSTGTSVYSNESIDRLEEKSNALAELHKKLNIIPSTTPLQPTKETPWKSVDNLKINGSKENNTKLNRNENIDKEFDVFTQERVQVKKPNPVPLEPNVLILNVPKNNLGTVTEDDEKHDEIHSIISETASSITQFCRTNFLNREKSKETNTKSSENNDIACNDSNPFSDDMKEDKIKSNSDPLMNAPIADKIEVGVKSNVVSKPKKVEFEDVKLNEENDSNSKFAIKSRIDNEKLQAKLSKEDSLTEDLKEETEEVNSDKKIREDSPAPNDFDEFARKPKLNFQNKDGIEARRMTMPENRPFLRDRSASIGTLDLKTPITQFIVEQNRTMLFQVGRSELRLISPDRKQILLHRAFKDVASCVVGRSNKDHFGFVCRESANDTYACYVFKCESDSVATEVINAIKQAFVAHADLLKKSREKSPNMTCEHCPMLWYHRLCHDVDGMNEKKTHAFILRRIEQLPDDEQDLIVTKYQGGTNHMYEVSEHNAFLMMLLRAHCESKQHRHVHDTAENRSEFLNQYLGGSTIFMKAKRSISSGFDHFLKRRASRDDVIIPQNIKKETSPLPEIPPEPSAPELLTPEPVRCKSSSPGPASNMDASPPPMPPTVEERDEDMKEEEANTPSVNSPMMDIFLKVSDNRPSTTGHGAETDATWRQTIYKKVMQPECQGEELLPIALLGSPKLVKGKRTKEELRLLWKMAIDQTILLVRMEKENDRLKESEESSAVRRIKLEYTELSVSDTGVTLMWDSLLTRDGSQPMARVDRHMLTQAVIQGVPRMSRGGVWYFLAEQFCLRAPPPDIRNFPHYNDPYKTLLSGLTKHQHAILIDLGRTFPKHSYFASALGPGQLALYNILKAYSLLDPDVGYCQGLSFVAGVLLLHMEEAEAFVLLRHLMFRRGLRKQYLPDMVALQVQLYQLSRLLRDHEPELHAKLESLDISPALYAAPWMLTLFTSQFPLGFVVRVFDLIFLESLDVVFSFSLALLSAHKDGLMMCESCEEAAEYLKHKLPDMGRSTYLKVMRKVQSLDISRQLADYAVEYAVLREEMPRMATLTEENRLLTADKDRMTEELDSAMDAITNYQKSQARLESQNRQMDQQLALLSRYLSTHQKQELPLEIKKIIQNYSKKISFSSKILKFTTNEDEENDPKKNFKTGVSAPNLFAKISKEEILNAVNKEKNSSDIDRRQFMMKKSQSVHSGLIANNLKQVPLKVLEEKSENDYRRSDSFRTEILTESLRELGKKNSGYFANTHEQIRQERMFEKQLKHDFDQNLRKLDEKTEPKSHLDDVNLFQSRKSMSLNLKPTNIDSKADYFLDSKLNSMRDSSLNVSPVHDLRRDSNYKPDAKADSDPKLNSKVNSYSKTNSFDGDSGFVTPLSPNENDRKDDSCSVISHPLSDCDVDIKFDGQSTKLKQIRPLKSNFGGAENK